MASWTESQTGARGSEGPYKLFLHTLLGRASEAEIEERYVALARAILAGEPSSPQAA